MIAQTCSQIFSYPDEKQVTLALCSEAARVLFTWPGGEAPVTEFTVLF